jgi:heptosyltransferase III
VVQRSNGDVFLSVSLIKSLYNFYKSPDIDLLVNEDTYQVASLLPNINNIYKFSYALKKDRRLKQEKNIIQSIYKKYDLSISLTASDRSVIYALLGGKISICAIEKEKSKSWWKKLLLSHYYYFDSSQQILINNLQPLKILNINHESIQKPIDFLRNDYINISKKFKLKDIGRFIIFHPSAQYEYKIYPKKLRDKLLKLLSSLGIAIIVTGGNSDIDFKIKDEIPSLSNVYNFIGKTSIKDYFILSQLSLAYIGMDTLNMHVAASQSKRIFAIFGPTKLSLWSPWSNSVKMSTSIDNPIQTYGENTIFQADMKCVACGKKGCEDSNLSKCLNNIDPKIVFEEVRNWYVNA